MDKTIFLMMDAWRYDAVQENAGFLEHLIEAGLGAKYRLRGELPSMSRPMYETVLTGTPSSVHGIVNNDVIRLSTQQSVFHLCRAAGGRTAAAAYFWISELYCRAPFCPMTDRYRRDSDTAIQNGTFYYEDFYPDSHLFVDAEHLRQTCDPDFLLIHPMNADLNGHRHGGFSNEYRDAVRRAAELMSPLLVQWREQGYQIAVSADHGMTEGGYHGGNTLPQRDVPLYIFSPKVLCGDFTDTPISQLNMAPLLCRLLGIAPGKAMRQQSEIRFR